MNASGWRRARWIKELTVLRTAGGLSTSTSSRCLGCGPPGSLMDSEATWASSSVPGRCGQQPADAPSATARQPAPQLPSPQGEVGPRVPKAARNRSGPADSMYVRAFLFVGVSFVF